MIYIDPCNDGKDHINVYSKAMTDLGRMLSNFYIYPFKNEDGNFKCIEGYWFWLGCSNICPEEDKNRLRDTDGYHSNKLGRSLHKRYGRINDQGFRSKILSAIEIKFEANKGLLLPKYYDLPIYHYYNYSGRVIDVTEQFQWYVDGITFIRDSIIEHL